MQQRHYKCTIVKQEKTKTILCYTGNVQYSAENYCLQMHAKQLHTSCGNLLQKTSVYKYTLKQLYTAIMQWNKTMFTSIHWSSYILQSCNEENECYFVESLRNVTASSIPLQNKVKQKQKKMWPKCTTNAQRTSFVKQETLNFNCHAWNKKLAVVLQ